MKRTVLLFSLIFIFCLNYIFAEDITIVTYYPVAYGLYNSAEVSQSLLLRTDSLSPSADAPQVEWLTSTVGTNYHWNIDQYESAGSSKLRFYIERNDHSVSGTEKVNFPQSGGIQMLDGNQSAGRVLVSDANGLGSWQDAPAIGLNCVEANNISQRGDDYCRSLGTGYACTYLYRPTAPGNKYGDCGDPVRPAPNYIRCCRAQ